MLIAIQSNIGCASIEGLTIRDRRFSVLNASQYLEMMAEGARFELAAHEVGAGFQDRWIKPLSHPSDDKIDYLRQAWFVVPADGPICESTAAPRSKLVEMFITAKND